MRNLESGYTLIETLVAMVLFLSVLVPLGFGAATLLLDRKGADLEHALQIAESRMSETIAKKEFSQDDRVVESRYRVRRDIDLQGGLIEIRVSVSRIGAMEHSILLLTKTIVPAQ